MRETSSFTDLVFHALAFVPASPRASLASQAASLHWPAYIQLVQAELPRAAWQVLEEDAPLLSTLLEPVEVSHAIGLFAELHETVEQFLASATRELKDLGSQEVGSVAALDALRALPVAAVEIFRAGLALSAPAFIELRARVLVPFGAQVRRAILERLSAMGSIFGLPVGDVELSLTLGPRGRGFGTRTVVGIAGLPNDVVDPDLSIVLALHELTVHRAAALLRSVGRQAHWADVEAVAVALEQQLARGTPLEAAQRGWLAGLDLGGLSALDETLAMLVERGARWDFASPRYLEPSASSASNRASASDHETAAALAGRRK